MQNITIENYAQKIEVSRQAILYRINNKIDLPGVKKIEKVGKAYILEFNEKTNLEEAKKNFKKI